MSQKPDKGDNLRKRKRYLRRRGRTKEKRSCLGERRADSGKGPTGDLEERD